MKTTNLFVELLVIGIGAGIWLILLFLSFQNFDNALLEQITTLNDFITTIIVVAIVYVLGVVTDRVADITFGKFSSNIRAKHYEDRKQVLADKVVIYKDASPLVDMIDYGRSRMRICRGWLLNLIGILLFGNIWFSQSAYANQSTFIGFNSLLLVLAIGLWIAWRNLTDKEYSKIKNISKILSN